AWAPRPVQVATARWLRDRDSWQSWHETMLEDTRSRLDELHHGIQAMKADGLPVDSIEPQGAIYISVRFGLVGMRTPTGKVLENNEDIRSYLLQEAAFAVVPFSAFGVEEHDEDGWSRASVGAISHEGIRAALPRLRAAMEALTR
ncbi:MAG: aminotransferase class I/II-fold pyridoxal phosphate-dependent enzyme, partial [Planctomycetota bacterium]